MLYTNIHAVGLFTRRATAREKALEDCRLFKVISIN